MAMRFLVMRMIMSEDNEGDIDDNGDVHVMMMNKNIDANYGIEKDDDNMNEDDQVWIVKIRKGNGVDNHSDYIEDCEADE